MIKLILMRSIVFALFAIMILVHPLTGQQVPRLDQNSIVKDTSGQVYSFSTWSQLLSSGRYKIKAEKKDNPEFIIVPLSEAEYEKNLENAPKPKESIYFKTGRKFDHFKTTDINGNKINTKDLAGKIIVLNFWFIQCPPCIREMPDLNIVADAYKDDSSVVFIAVSTDDKYRLQQFLKRARFLYTVIDNGRFISEQYRINGYPTNVVIDQEGKVYFHSTGYAMNTGYWIKKSIEEIKAKSVARVDTNNQ